MKTINNQSAYFHHKPEKEKYLSGLLTNAVQAPSTRAVKNLVCVCSKKPEALTKSIFPT